jgi:hypothetical protein
MRLVAIIVSFVSLMVAGVALFYVAVLGPAGEEPAAAKLSRERIGGLEKRAGELQQGIDRLRAESEILAERITAAEMSPGRAAPARRVATPAGGAAAGGADTERARPPEQAGESEEGDSLRRTIREEIVRLEEERKEEQKREWEAQKPEDWETEEFGFYAHIVHNTGRKLDMTAEQKRKYYAILKGHQDETAGLWEQLQKQYPGADTNQLSQVYRERTREMLDNARQFVRDILTAPQRKKYEEMSKESNWFK